MAEIRDERSAEENAIFVTVDEDKEKNKDKHFDIQNKNKWLICSDYSESEGIPSERYFVQDIWAEKNYILMHLRNITILDQLIS